MSLSFEFRMIKPLTLRSQIEIIKLIFAEVQSFIKALSFFLLTYVNYHYTSEFYFLARIPYILLCSLKYFF